jgi:hypothetical protein
MDAGFLEEMSKGLSDRAIAELSLHDLNYRRLRWKCVSLSSLMSVIRLSRRTIRVKSGRRDRQMRDYPYIQLEIIDHLRPSILGR